MGAASFLGMVGLAAVVAVGVRRYQPSVVGQLARQTGVDGRAGWAASLAAAAWAFLPLLAGARTRTAWAVGAAVAGVGCYLLVVAAGSVGEYRLLSGVDHLDPGAVRPGEPVAVTGEPTTEEPVRTVAGRPSVHVDWLVRRVRRVGARRTYVAVAGDVETADFALGDSVRVRATAPRVVSNAEGLSTVAPDEAPSDPVESFLAAHDDLPDPADREHTLRLSETYLPADEPVTVVGRPRQGAEPGEVVVDDEDGEVVFVRGDADVAERQLYRRVYWVGAAGLAMALGGQALGVALSAATLPV